MKVYLDNNATTKVDEEVVKAMIPYFSEYYGNPFSLHLFGAETGKAITQTQIDGDLQLLSMAIPYQYVAE